MTQEKAHDILDAVTKSEKIMFVISRQDFPLWRRAIAILAAVFTIGAWNCSFSSSATVLIVAIVLPIIGMNFRAPLAQMAVRASLWLSLIVGITNTSAKPIGSLAAALALVSLGGMGLRRKEGDSNSWFQPREYRGVLHAIGLLSIMQILFLFIYVEHSMRSFASEWMIAHPFRVVFELFWVMTSVVGLVGLYRMRIWGFLIHGFTTVALAAFSLLGETRLFGFEWMPIPSIVWLPISAASLLLLGVLGFGLATRRQWQLANSQYIGNTVLFLVAVVTYLSCD